MSDDPWGDEPEGDEPAATTDLEHVLARRAPRRSKALTVALIVVALGALVFNVWRTVGQSSAAIESPAVPLPVTVVAQIDGNVAGATIIINGQAYHSAYTLSVKLARGTYTIVLRADPLPALACRVTWPPDPSHDTCRDSNGQSSFDPNDTAHLHIALLLRPSDFPAATQAAILRAIPQGLAALRGALQTTVPAGQHYGGNLEGRRVPIAQIASAPLGASLRLALDDASCENPHCVAPAPIHFATGGSLEWVVEVPVRLEWQFASATGAPVENLAFPESQILTLGLLPMPDGTWRADMSYIGPDALSAYTQIAHSQCSIGFGLARAVVVPYESPRSPSAPPSANEAAPARIAQGCLLQVGTSSGTATFIFRFGALLAADSLAHSVAPVLPVASTQEITAATPGA